MDDGCDDVMMRSSPLVDGPGPRQHCGGTCSPWQRRCPSHDACVCVSLGVCVFGMSK